MRSPQAAPMPPTVPTPLPDLLREKAPAPPSDRLYLVGLCAQWCGVCREFEPQFEHLVRTHTVAHAQPFSSAWLDVEDELVAQALGDVDIETFPSIALGRAGGPLLFMGAILPHPAVLARLLDEAASPTAPAVVQDPAQQAAWQGLMQLLKAPD